MLMGEAEVLMAGATGDISSAAACARAQLMLQSRREIPFITLPLCLICSALCAAGNAQLQLRAGVRPEKLKPGAKLEALLIPLRPVSAELAPLQVGFLRHIESSALVSCRQAELC